MKRTFAKFLFLLVAAILIAWTASLTVGFVASALPHSAWYVPLLALVLFDAGMIAWLFVFLHHAEGTPQRAIAGGLTAFDFLGVGLMSFAEIFLGGQTIADIPQNIGTYAIWGLALWTVANVGAVLAFHIMDPAARQAIAIQNERDAIFELGLKRLAEQRQIHAERYGQALGQAMWSQLEDGLRRDINGDGIPDIVQTQTAGQIVASSAPPAPTIAAPSASPNA